MPKVYEEVILPCSRGKVFSEMTSVDFIKRIQPDVAIEFGSVGSRPNITSTAVGSGELRRNHVAATS